MMISSAGPPQDATGYAWITTPRKISNSLFPVTCSIKTPWLLYLTPPSSLASPLLPSIFSNSLGSSTFPLLRLPPRSCLLDVASYFSLPLTSPFSPLFSLVRSSTFPLLLVPSSPPNFHYYSSLPHPSSTISATLTSSRASTTRKRGSTL